MPGRAAIAAAYRTPEPICVPPLIAEARLDPAASADIERLAGALIAKVRGARAQQFGVEALMKEFSLSSPEGVALMCLAELLLRIPDAHTRDLLIRDKLSHGDWASHVGASRPGLSMRPPGACSSPASSLPRIASRAWRQR